MSDKQVILCPDCGGTGQASWVENIPGHNLERIEHKVICTLCNGVGRMVQTVSREPFIPEKSKDE